MKHGRICAQTEGDNSVVILPTVAKTSTVLERMRGLLGRPPLGSGEGLLLHRCNSVHTLFMRCPVDVVYLDRTYTVIKLVSALVPYRLSMAPRAVAVLELKAHEATRCDINVGMRLKWENI
ncbi:MAG: DUF192 domain-containing protein [Desulfuromonadaceae bacterium]